MLRSIREDERRPSNLAATQARLRARHRGFTARIVPLVILSGMLALAGCGEDEPLGVQAGPPGPDILVGTWQEVGYDRAVVLDQNGAFRFVVLENGVAVRVEGTGTWEATAVRITLRLTSGHYKRLQDSINTAPSSLTCDYEASQATLTLTLDIMSTVSTIRYSRLD